MTPIGTLPFDTVDVFTQQAFSGNSLAIVQNADGLTDCQMQLIAREFNLPETIFIQKPDDAANTARVRIFLPTDEIPFAGHPTIGCAIFIAQHIYTDNVDFETVIRLEEVAGLVPVSVKRTSGEITAQFTAPLVPEIAGKKHVESPFDLDISTIARALSLSDSDIDQQFAEPAAYAGGPTFIFAPLVSREALAQVRVVESVCNGLTSAYAATGIYVYYPDPLKNEIDSRMFAPGSGIPEDPATGSASALLAAQLQVAGKLKNGLNCFSLRQGYDMGRPSELGLEIELRDSLITAVRVAGSSVPMGSGEIRIPD